MMKKHLMMKLNVGLIKFSMYDWIYVESRSFSERRCYFYIVRVESHSEVSVTSQPKFKTGLIWEVALNCISQLPMFGSLVHVPN